MNQILLVEGTNDLHVFKTIFKEQHIRELFEVIEKGNDDQLIKSIPIHLKTDIKTIGIILDADEDINKRWINISKILKKEGYLIPENTTRSGLIIENTGLPKLGIWLMPDNNINGMLEDFVHQLIPKDDAILPFVDRVLNDLENLGIQKYKKIHQSKAKIHTWLSWQEDPGTPMGLAITKKYLNPDNELCLLFLEWVKQLYY